MHTYFDKAAASAPAAQPDGDKLCWPCMGGNTHVAPPSSQATPLLHQQHRQHQHPQNNTCYTPVCTHVGTHARLRLETHVHAQAVAPRVAFDAAKAHALVETTCTVDNCACQYHLPSAAGCSTAGSSDSSCPEAQAPSTLQCALSADPLSGVPRLAGSHLQDSSSLWQVTHISQNAVPTGWLIEPHTGCRCQQSTPMWGRLTTVTHKGTCRQAQKNEPQGRSPGVKQMPHTQPTTCMLAAASTACREFVVSAVFHVPPNTLQLQLFTHSCCRVCQHTPARQ